MNQTNNQTTPQNLKQDTSPLVVTDTDNKVENPFANIAGIVQLSEDPNSIYHYFVASPMYAGFGDLGSPERLSFLDDMSKAPVVRLKTYLTSAETVELIFSLGKECSLQDDQISQVGALVRELLIGKIFIKDFPMTISSKLGIDDVKAEEIANKIISKSFQPIIEDIKRIQRSKFPDKIMELQKASRPPGLNQPASAQQRPPLQMSRSQNDRGSSIQSGPPRPLPQQGEVRPYESPPAPQDQQFKVPPSLSNIDSTQKSLEEELNKAVNVIDLRNRPEKTEN